MPTLASVLRTPGLHLEVLVEGGGELPVRWIATSELDDPTPFLEGGEIVLTTGLAMTGWDAEWSAYVRRLDRAGAVAIGLGTGLTHQEAPCGLVDAARAAGVALFTVPRAVPFVAVSRAVARLLQQEEQQALRAALTAQRQLTRAAAAREGAEAILRRLEQIVDGTALVCDPTGTVLGRGREPGPERPVPPEISEHIARLRSSGLRASHTESGPSGTTLIQPLGLSNPPHSYLTVSTVGPWDAAKHSALATAAALLSLQGQRRADAVAASREIRGAAFALLRGGQVASAHALLEFPTAAATPLDERARFHVVRVEVPADVADALPLLERWAEHDEPGRLVTVAPDVDGQVAVVLRAGSDVAALAAVLGPDGRIGLGEDQPLDALARSDATAVAALARATPDRPVVRFDDVVDEGLLGLLPEPVASAFAHRVLGPLAAPTEENTHLLTTLDAFQRHHGQLTVVAAELGVHRNTVRRRLEQVQRLTGRSPHVVEHRVELWVAAAVLLRS